MSGSANRQPNEDLGPITADRNDTDERLLAERQQTDQLLEAAPAAAAGEVFDEYRSYAEEKLQEVREQVDSHLEKQAAVLPALSDKLDDVADGLAETAAIIAKSSEESAPTPAQLMDRLAEIAGGMAEVTAELEFERDAADRKLRAERELADQIIEQQIEQTTTVSAIQQHERLVLDQEREATDADLAKERQHTDEAIEQVLHAFESERTAHTIARHEFATRNEFLAIVSHDLRGPLGAAATAASRIMETALSTSDGRQMRGWAERINRSLATMDRLIRDLLDFASFEDGMLQVTKKRQDLGALLTEMVFDFQSLAATKSLALTAVLPDEPVLVSYDRDRLMQVVGNLLQNAIKFTPNGGSIDVRATANSAEATVAITDTGVGIAEEELSSIFERFKQLDSDRSGLGLGLYISKWIVEAHGGHIWAESAPGQGATFQFTLPC